MRNERFEKLVRERVEKIQKVLGVKSGDYARGGDRLHNFKVAAQARGISPLQALDGMMLKHEVCFIDLVTGATKPTKEFVDEKLGDFINYLILAEALLVEEIEASAEAEK